MSQNYLSKSLNYSKSPIFRDQKILPIAKITQLHKQALPGLTSSHNVLPTSSTKINPVYKIVRIASTQKYNQSSPILNTLSSKLNTNLKILSQKNLRIESILSDKLKKESDFPKKFDIIISTLEKLCNLDRNFGIFYTVVKEFFLEFKEDFIKKSENLQNLEENYNNVKSEYLRVVDELLVISDHNKKILIESEALKQENNQMRLKIIKNQKKKYDSGEKKAPVEKTQQDFYGKIRKPIVLKKRNSKRIETLESEFNPIPKTNIRYNLMPEIKVKKSYQQTCMEKLLGF